MKKKDLFEGIVARVDFPNKGIVFVEGEKVQVSNVIEGQKIQGMITKKNRSKYTGALLKVLERSPFEVEPICGNTEDCGGCLYQTMPYQKQIDLKKRQVNELLLTLHTSFQFEGILESPSVFGYRNKMEYSFGDTYKEGPLALGLHRRASRYDVVNTKDCKLVHNDFNKILSCTLSFFQGEGLSYFSKKDHIGYLRHLVLRRGEKTGEILINLVTTSQVDYDLGRWVESLNSLELSHSIVGILHTINDHVADAVKADELLVLQGRDFFYEDLLGMRFKVSPFSFFQTNTLGAEVLYSVIREYVGDTRDKVIFDLYSGTGTIAQILAPVAKKVVGIEIVEEATDAAKENAVLNKLLNCEFITGDVLKILDEVEGKPDIIVLDPPRDGIHPKAIHKIIDYGAKQIVYVSCKPTSLVRDLKIFLENEYRLSKVKCVDLFAHTGNIETVCFIEKKE